jgi:hypothetical protein
MAHWLLKSEADSYGWDDLVRDSATDGTAYATPPPPSICAPWRWATRRSSITAARTRRPVGIVTVTRAARADGEDGRWVSVEVAPDRLPPVTLAMKAEARLADLPMLRQSRLSVSPVGEGRMGGADGDGRRLARAAGIGGRFGHLIGVGRRPV